MTYMYFTCQVVLLDSELVQLLTTLNNIFNYQLLNNSSIVQCNFNYSTDKCQALQMGTDCPNNGIALPGRGTCISSVLSSDGDGGLSFPFVTQYDRELRVPQIINNKNPYSQRYLS